MKCELIITLFLFLLMACNVSSGEEETEQIRLLFTEGAALSEKSNYAEVIPLYQQLILLSPAGENAEDMRMLKIACKNLMYSYVYSGTLADGIGFYMDLYQRDDVWLMQHGRRCVEVSLAYLLYLSGRLPEAVEMIEKAIERPEEQQYRELLGADYGIASAIYFQNSELEKAIEYSEKSLAMPTEQTDERGILSIRVNLIYMYHQAKEYEKSFFMYEELMKIPAFNQDVALVNSAELNIAAMLGDWELDDMEVHIRNAKNAAHASGSRDVLLRTYMLEIDFLFAHGSLTGKVTLDIERVALLKDSMALYLPPREQFSYYHLFYDYFDCAYNLWTAPAGNREVVTEALQLIDLFKQNVSDRTAVGCYLTLSKGLYGRGEFEHAIRGLEYCIEPLLATEQWNMLRYCYWYLAELYEKRNDPSHAIQYYRLHNDAKEQYMEKANAVLMSRFRVQYRTLEQEQANLVLQTDLEIKRKTIRYYLTAGICFALVALLFIGWLFARNRILHLKNEAGVRGKEIETLRRREAQSVIQKQEEELRRMVNERLEMNRKNEELREEIELAGAQTQLQGLMEDLSPRLLTEEEERAFRRKYSLVYPGFIQRLRDRFPGITPAEELLSMLIGLKLNNREISLALGIHTASVHTSRSRLRKKFDISKEESLEEFIRMI